MQGQELVEIDSNKVKAEGVNLMQREISYVTENYIRHNPDAIAASIIGLICDDLKFKDMQNDTKYVLLNDRLKEAKKALKESNKHDNIRQTKKKRPREESKFFQKYKDRIESIQEAELKMKVKAGIPIEEKQETIVTKKETKKKPVKETPKKPKGKTTKTQKAAKEEKVTKTQKAKKQEKTVSKVTGKHSK